MMQSVKNIWSSGRVARFEHPIMAIMPSAPQLVLLLMLSCGGGNSAVLLERCEPAVVPADAGTTSVVIRGRDFPKPAVGSALSCHVRGGMYYAEPVAPPANNTVATWLNSTAVRCEMPPAIVSYDAHLDIKLDGNESYSNPQAHNASSLPALNFRTFVQVGFGRRPYLSNETAAAELVLWPDIAAITAFTPTRTAALLHVCYAFVATDGPGARSGGGSSSESSAARGRRTCHTLPLPKNGAASALAIQLEHAPSHVGARDLNISVDISLLQASGDASLLQLNTKYRRLMIAPTAELGSVGSFVAVDHRRRALRVNGEVFVTQGYYFYGFVNYVRGDCTLERALDDLTGLSQQGAKTANNSPHACPEPVLTNLRLGSIRGLVPKIGACFCFVLSAGVNHVVAYSLQQMGDTDRVRAVAHLENHGT
jgi:hypothetical protein